VAAPVGAAGLHCRAAVALAGAGGCCTVALTWKTWQSLATQAGRGIVSTKQEGDRMPCGLYSFCCGMHQTQCP
jgi:hypothetical protein